ncbi:MAG: Pr6Pr family membrane protein [Pseudomonadota bacterium]
MKPWPSTRVAALRLTFGLLVLVAVGTQLVLHVRSGYNIVNFFSYFTNLSNLFAAVVLLMGAAASWTISKPPGDLARAIAVVNMAVVGVVFAILLRNVDLGDLRPWVNTVLHYVMPCVVVMDWLLVPPKTKLGLKPFLLVLVIPVLYIGYVLVRGSLVQWYPYPFLNPMNVGGYSGVAAYVVGIAVAFVIAAGALLAVGNRFGQRG